MEINDWVQMNYINLKKASNAISKNNKLANDLFHESLLVFLEDKKAHYLVNTGGATWYIVRIMMNNWNSFTSPFYKKYKKECWEYYETDQIEEKEDMPTFSDKYFDQLEIELENLHWYSREILNLKLEKEIKLSTIHRETGIPAASLYKEYQNTKKLLRKNIMFNISIQEIIKKSKK